MTYSDLLIWQYQGKLKALATVQMLEAEFSQGFIDLYQLQDVLNIETTTGDQLDLVGKHVGQSRVINSVFLRKFFGFHNAPNALSFSKQRKGGGKWYRRRDPVADSVRLDDEDYRFLIKCRIIKNYQTGTLPNLIEACRFIFKEEFVVTDNLDMTVTVAVNLPEESLTKFVRYTIRNLDILPRAAGVKINFKFQ